MKPLSSIVTRLIFSIGILASHNLLAKEADNKTVYSNNLAERFARLPTFSSPKLSPDGKSYAFLLTHEGEQSVITKPIDPNDKLLKAGAIPLNGAHIHSFDWANNERLLIAVRLSSNDKTVNSGIYRYKIKGGNFVRIFSIDRSGTDPVFFEMETSKLGLRLRYPQILSKIEDDKKHVLMTLDSVDDEVWPYPKVHKVNIYTGEKTLVDGNRGKYHRFMATSKTGNVRVAVKYGVGTGTKNAIYIKPDNNTPWKLFQKKEFTDASAYIPYRIDYDDDNALLMIPNDRRINACDEDDLDLKILDLTTGNFTEDYQDPQHQLLKNTLAKTLPNQKICRSDFAGSLESGIGIYKAYSDIQAPQYLTFDVAKKRIDFLADGYPGIKDFSLSKVYKTGYKVRDGMDIPALLTLPSSLDKNGKVEKPIATIIFPHGGPWAKNYWGYDNYAQFFAAKGYAVLQPQFRGSTGFGVKHFEAGIGEWGLKIQDDITDGTRWLIEEGIADPKKICIVGAGFGGYATGVGLYKEPDLYQCGISINGVLNMKKFAVEVIRNNEYNEELTNSEFGIKKVSPFHQAKKIKAPLMLIYGDKDTVVNPDHSTKMHKRMQKLKKHSELVLLPNGEHWRTNEANEITLFKAMDKFLSAYLD